MFPLDFLRVSLANAVSIGRKMLEIRVVSVGVSCADFKTVQQFHEFLKVFVFSRAEPERNHIVRIMVDPARLLGFLLRQLPILLCLASLSACTRYTCILRKTFYVNTIYYYVYIFVSRFLYVRFCSLHPFRNTDTLMILIPYSTFINSLCFLYRLLCQ